MELQQNVLNVFCLLTTLGDVFASKLLITRAPDLGGCVFSGNLHALWKKGFLCYEMHRTYTLPCTTVPAIDTVWNLGGWSLGVLRGQWLFLGWGASFGWGSSLGPPLFNYINIYLYLYVPVWGAGGICQRPTVLLYLPILHTGSKMWRVHLDCSSPLVVHIFK